MLLTGLSIATKAAMIVILALIMRTDFTTQKIRNRHLVYLLAAAVLLATVRIIASGSGWQTLGEIGAGAVLFVALIAFWLTGKVGAGDVKLLVLIPLVVGAEGSLTFVVGLLILSFATYFVMRFPTVVPKRWFRSYLQGLGRTGRVPFGVPISIAAMIAILIPLSLLPPTHGPGLDQTTELDFTKLAETP